MRFSLIICTLGRRDELGAFFASLLRQGSLATECQVILVDQNADDRLAPIVADYAGRLSIEHLKQGGTGLSRARNLGLRHALGEIVGFPDDDCEYPPELLTRVDALFARSPWLGGITGHPTPTRDGPPPRGWEDVGRVLDRVGVMNRCQEFTIFLRRDAIGGVRFNETLGVGAQTPWGSDEGPDFLIRVIARGSKVAFHPKLFVYHPDKIATMNRKTYARAASYARGRGCFFRLHKYPAAVIAKSVLRPLAGSLVYLARLQPKRSAYYLAVAGGMTRGLLIGRRELAAVAAGGAAAETDVVAAARLPMSPLTGRPLVSVLVANFNYARFLPAALDGLLAQTYGHWEAIVCDDGSTDDSVAVVRAYADRDHRVRLVQKENGGQNSTVNEAHRHTRGEVVCLLDADDTFEPTKLERVVAAFSSRPAAGLCTHFAAVIDGDGRPLPATLNARLDDGWLGGDDALSRGGCVYVPTTSCLSFRREVLDELMPLPASQPSDADGYLCMAAALLAEVVRVDAALSGYRVHGGNMGGLTEPTPERLRYELTLIRRRTATLKAFVGGRFGRDVAARLSASDNPQYVQAALKLLAVDPAAVRDVGLWPRDLIARLPSPKWRAIWRAIFALPAALRPRVLAALHASHGVKAVAHRLAGRATRRPVSGRSSAETSLPDGVRGVAA